MTRFLYRNHGTTTSLGLFLMRLIAGGLLANHGWMKIQHPFNWMGDGAPVPGFLQALAAFSEFGGGLAFIVGLLTPVAALGVTITMITAIAMVHAKNGDPIGMTGKGGSWEPALMYLSISLALFFTGAGRFSLDKLLFDKRSDA